MSEITPTLPSPRPKRWLLAGLTGLVLLVAGAGGGFVLMRDPDMILQLFQSVEAEDSGPSVAYVALDPVVVNLPRASGRQMLRFTANLEVGPQHAAEVTLIRPRILDVLNGYLRAVDPADFEEQAILADLRSQLLRRVQVVAGEGRVRDLLITEFVLN